MSCDHTPAEIREMAHNLHIQEQASLIREALANETAGLEYVPRELVPEEDVWFHEEGTLQRAGDLTRVARLFQPKSLRYPDARRRA